VEPEDSHRVHRNPPLIPVPKHIFVVRTFPFYAQPKIVETEKQPLLGDGRVTRGNVIAV
jgi:hypothetical protein